MNSEELIRANCLDREIRELESFIYTAQKVWTGKIIKQNRKYIFKSSPYGALHSQEFNMNTTIKNRVLNVLREYLEELKQELDAIGNKEAE